MGTPNTEPQEYSRNTTECKDPNGYIPIIFLQYSWGSLFGVPNNVPLVSKCVGLSRANGLAVKASLGLGHWVQDF